MAVDLSHFQKGIWSMKSLRVLILFEGRVIDLYDFDDPRQRFIFEFNQLNEPTPYHAILEELPEIVSLKQRHPPCDPPRRCGSLKSRVD